MATGRFARQDPRRFVRKGMCAGSAVRTDRLILRPQTARTADHTEFVSFEMTANLLI